MKQQQGMSSSHPDHPEMSPGGVVKVGAGGGERDTKLTWAAYCLCYFLVFFERESSLSRLATPRWESLAYLQYGGLLKSAGSTRGQLQMSGLC